jgi:hypothetical protein
MVYEATSEITEQHSTESADCLLGKYKEEKWTVVLQDLASWGSVVEHKVPHNIVLWIMGKKKKRKKGKKKKKGFIRGWCCSGLWHCVAL